MSVKTPGYVRQFYAPEEPNEYRDPVSEVASQAEIG